jgi:hypothetical protein
MRYPPELALICCSMSDVCHHFVCLFCYHHHRMEPGMHVILDVYIVKHGYKWHLVKVIDKRGSAE